MLKRIWQKIILEQKGQMLPLVLVLMLIGGLLVVPTLNYASTSLKAKQVTEKKTLELYAADAGVEEALSYLSQLVGNWPTGAPWKGDIEPYVYISPTPAPGDYYERDESLVINDKTVDGVDVTIRREGSPPYYNITSTATSTDGSSTTVTSYVEFTDFSCLFDNIVTTRGELEDPGGAAINGTTKNATDYAEQPWPWPTAEQLERYYLDKVDTSVLFLDDHIHVNGASVQEELYRDVEAEDFVIRGASPEEGNKLTLNGIVYIKGNLKLGVTQDFTLDLNGETIFVEGTITTGTQAHITLVGSGCIIAEGLVTFQPGITTDPTQFVFIMSVESTVDFRPNPGFNGAIASLGDVTLQKGHGSYNHTAPPLDDEDNIDLNFPGGTDAPIAILSWQIS